MNLTLSPARVLAVIFMLIGIGAGKAGEVRSGEAIFNTVCMACHGKLGEGNLALKAPSIAGMASWYVQGQLKSFREGHRGTDPTEPQPLLMAATAKSLAAGELVGLADYVQSLKPVLPVVTEVLKGADLASGRDLFQERCMECHRYNASGEVVFGSPPLTGRQDWYLLEQIQRFKSGKRGAVPGDVNGAKMVFSVQHIGDDQIAKDVVAYILTLNPVPEVVTPFDLPAASGH
jgi:cytochrome c553